MITEASAALSPFPEWQERIRVWEATDGRRCVLCDRIRDLKRTVTCDLENFRLVFPEFTPHDVQLHADRLVQITEAVLGPTTSDLSVVEYLVLIASIYGHDWGMSVSDEEREAIRLSAFDSVTRETHPGQTEGIHLLPDDGKAFSAHVNKCLGLESNIRSGELPNGIWSDYLRATHARRSGNRIRAFFQEEHARFGDYVALVAEGHLAEEEEIADATRYRTAAAPVLDDRPVNLQALAVYLRLVDLFDISDERTPYSMWRFVNPQDRHSRLEWAKHLSLAPVRRDEKTGALVFQGEVSDPDVWARVSDLRAYSEQQFASGRALLSKRSDVRYHLPFHWLDWDGVITRGIPPEVVRFEFSRETLFTILSEEVYDKDPYVFIRELLQNAIDATESRRLVLQQHGASLPEATPIIVECASRAEGNYTFAIRDSGIGMDPFVIQHYLAMAGRSFYRSSDFMKLGIEYDAISRFGIGILSCFMVADSIEIETQPEPYAFPDSQGMLLRIDDMTTHWAVRHAPPDSVPVGTVVKVHVSAKKVALLRGTKLDVVLKEWRLSRSQLAVTSYLKTIAGFVQYPILVDEAGARTAILHPKFDERALPVDLRREYPIHKLGLAYPLQQAVTPGSAGPASRFFHVETLDVEQDLGLEGIEGSLSFPVPVNTSFLVGHRNPTELEGSYGIKFYSYQGGFINRRSMSLCENGARDKYVACFCNGIFVPGVKYPPQLWGDEGKKAPEQRCGTWALSGVQLFLNLKRRCLNAARDHLAEDGNWADEVLAAAGRHFADSWRDELLAAEPLTRLRLLCRYGQFYPVSLFEVADAIGVENWPVCHLADGGRVEVVSWQDLQTEAIATVPAVLQEECGVAIEELLRGKDDLSIPWLESWNGLPLLLGPWSNWIGCSHYEPLTRMPLLRLGFHAETRWLDPPVPGLPPVEQEVWTVSPSAEDTECGQGKLSRAEMKKKARGWCNFDHNDDGRYPAAFDGYCFWGPRLVNSRHELGATLLDVLLLTGDCPELSWRTAAGDRVMHWFSGFLGPRTRGRNGIDFDAASRELQALAHLVAPHDPNLAARLAGYRISREDFLPGVFRLRKDGKLEHWNYGTPHSSGGISLIDILHQPGIQPWGHLLDSGTPWPTWEDLEPVFMGDDCNSES